MCDPITILLDLLDLPDEIRVNFAFEKVENLTKPPVLDFTFELFCQLVGILLRISCGQQTVRRLQMLNDEPLECGG